jgi:hypothetical protein
MGMAYFLSAQARSFGECRAQVKPALPIEYREKKGEIKMPVVFFSEKKAQTMRQGFLLLYGYRLAGGQIFFSQK